MFFDEPGRRDQSQMMGVSPASRSILPTHLQWPTLAFALAASVLCFFDIDSNCRCMVLQEADGMAGGQRSALGQRFCFTTSRGARPSAWRVSEPVTERFVSSCRHIGSRAY